MNPVSIGVIISTYNKPIDLDRVIRSYGMQTDHAISIYVADDGSQEETAARIRSLAEAMPFPVHHIRHEDQGFRLAEIRNRAILTAKEDYLLITDGDCLAPPNLIATHRRFAQPGCFVTGSRILLSPDISEAIRSQTFKLEDLWNPARLMHLRMSKQLNRIWPLLMPAMLGPASTKLSGIRGCHMALWRDDLLRVNGYDQGYRGWGREDSDLAARLFHVGVRRRSMIGAPMMHLWHPEAARKHLNANDQRLAECLREKRKRAPTGIEELE